ncbi:Permease [Petrocella atlantisensis]|uniref:Permease n=1 Tax=Petrocella atlantisensis TaxID=2173034 RepID=A0A3P7S0V8_9FIRM|nr:permease [Petrocella atlantisensis]VDN46549.1 Permease [Petrocella atlantisensis]
MTTTIFFYTASILLTLLSYFRDKEKTKMALKKAYKAFTNLLPALIPMILFVGIMLTLVSPDLIGKLLGDESGLIGIIIGAVLGSIVFMPSFVAFSLGENLLIGGAGYPQVAVFISTLMAVGISSLAIELKYFNNKTTILRNVFALLASLIFAGLIGVIL